MKQEFTILLAAALLFVAKGFATTTTLGASAFNQSDVTAVIQNAFNSTVDTVVIQNVGQPWIVQPLFIKRDNLTVIFNSGVVLQAKSGAFTDLYSCLLFVGDNHLHRVKNVTLIGYGATFKMIKPEYTTGEWRHCLKLSWVENVKVEGFILRDSGGDGIEVMRNYFGDPCLNVHIKNCVMDNNRRQGISVISAVDLLIENCELKNTTGANPMAGIDFEPDSRSVDLTNQALKNILVRNCRFTNNGGSGIEIALHQPFALIDPVSMRFENCYIKGVRGISAFASNEVKGFVEFNQCLVENVSEVGISVLSNAYAGINTNGNNPNLAFVKFKECVFRNMAANFDSPIQIVGQLWGDVKTNINEYGGVEFKDCVLEGNKTAPFLISKNEFSGSQGAANIKGNIIVVNPNNSGASLGLDVNSHDIGLVVTSVTTPVSVSATIAATDAVVSETGPNTGTFTISRNTNAPSIPSAIHYQLSGTATQALDYNFMSGFVYIPASQTSGTAIITPLADTVSDLSESVIATIILNDRPSGVNASYTIGNPSSATVLIDDQSGSGGVTQQTGTAFRWNGNSSATANGNKFASTLLNDNSTSATVWLNGNTAYLADKVNAYQSAGLIFSSARNITSIEFVNGAYSGGNGSFASELQVQTSVDGNVWINASDWTVLPVYSYGSSSIGNSTFTFTGSTANIKGIRITGRVRTCNNGCSRDASIKEITAMGTNYTGNTMRTITPTSASIESGSNEVLVYPNPTRSNFIINNLKTKDVVKIVSADGKLVYQRLAAAKFLSVDINGWGKGMYIINIIRNRKQVSKNLVVE